MGFKNNEIKLSVSTSESPGQNLLGEIRGIQYLGHWICRSDVGQIAPQTEPNPRYRPFGPKSDKSKVTTDDCTYKP